MKYPLTGYHHITACARQGRREDVTFFTQSGGLEDGEADGADGWKNSASITCTTSNANIQPGSVMTTFPYSRKAGKQGSGQVRSTSFTVSSGTLPFWKDHLKRHNVDQSPVEERFGQAFLRFRHPAGLACEVIEDKDDGREGWTTPEIGKGEAVHGFHGAVLSVREVEETERFFIEALGFRKTGVDGAYHRFETGTGGANKTITLVHEPDRSAGSWTFGAGTVHHIALWGADDAALAEQKAIYEELGYTDASEIKDRFYFHSMYCRCPGGILVESCCNVPGGFEKDEKKEELGTKLHIPPWFEERRAEIVAELEPIRVPETATAR